MILTSAESIDRILWWGVRCATTKSLFIDLIKNDIFGGAVNFSK